VFCAVFFLVATILVPFSLCGLAGFHVRRIPGWRVFGFILAWCSMSACAFWPSIGRRTTISRIRRARSVGNVGGSGARGDPRPPRVIDLSDLFNVDGYLHGLCALYK
jgi:hypothetical protein